MMISTLGRDIEYSRYHQWDKIREAQHQRLVRQALRKPSTLPASPTSRLAVIPRPDDRSLNRTTHP